MPLRDGCFEQLLEEFISERTYVRRFIAMLFACSLLAAACAGDSTAPSEEGSAAVAAEPTTIEPEATAAPSPPSSTSSVAPPEDPQAPGDLLDGDYLDALARDVSPSDGAFMVAAVNQAGETVVGTAGTDADGNVPTASDAFRVGSITKVFTSLTTLTLVEEGLVSLDGSASDYVTRVPIDTNVTVRDLLRHRTGIDNYTDTPGFFPTVFENPERVWTPEEQVDLVVDRAPLFEPGLQFSYSNTNDIILGILIEEVTGRPYHQVARDRVINPLGLSSTYLAGFEDGPEPFDPFVEGGETEYDYTSIATSAWSAGAMVSNAEDLHTLFTALFDEKIVSEAMLNEMTAGSFYGLGVDLAAWPSGLIGHDGGIPGYTTFVRHSTESGITAFTVSTDDGADPSPAIGAVIAALVGDTEDSEGEAADPPPNDLFANAEIIDPAALPFSATVDTTGATSDGDDLEVGCPAPSVDASVWYSITPTSDVQLLVSADGSDYSYGVSAFTGDPGSVEFMECRPFPFTVEAQADVTFHIQVFDHQADGRGNGGTLVFTIEEAS